MKYSVLAKEVGEVIKLALLSIESLHIYDDKCSNSKITINRGMNGGWFWLALEGE